MNVTLTRLRASLTLTCLMILCATLFASCGEIAATLGHRVKYPQETTPQIQSAFDRAEGLYRIRNYPQAYEAFRDFSGRFPYNKLTDEAQYKMGKIHFLNAEYMEAHGLFLQLSRKSPDPEYRAKASLMAASSSFQLSQPSQALVELKTVKESAIPVKMRVQLYSLVILSVAKTHTDTDFSDYATVRLYEVYEDGFSQGLQSLRGNDIVDYGRARGLLETWILKPMKVADISSWMRRYPKGTVGRGYIDYKIGKVYAEEGVAKKARQILSDFVNGYPKNPYVSAAEKLLEGLGGLLINSSKPVKHTNIKVGLILPLSGPLGTYGQEVISGVRCAAGSLNLCGADTGAELIVRDAGSGPEAVSSAIQEMQQQGVSAIIGPMSASLAVPAAISASGYKIPIFPITQKTGLMQSGDYVFQVGMTAEQQIHQLVSYARGRGLKRIAVLAPSSEYGSTFTTLFVNEVAAQGGEIVARVSYAPGTDATMEIARLKQAVPLDAAGKLQCDAVFIPDSYMQMNVLASPLAEAGFAGMPLLGTNAWNDGRLSLAIASQFPGSFFVDVYDANSNSQDNRDFRSGYAQAFGSDPSILSAMGYDTMQIILRASEQKGSAGIKDALEGRLGFRGVTVLRGFIMGKEPIVDPVMLKVTETGIHE